MSWAVEEWKVGLSGKALQKIQELEGQLDKHKKERQQKQFQLDSLEAALQKQKQKVDIEKNEVAVLKRENQSLVESCESLEKTRQRISHELQVKDQQVNCLEGQISSSKKQIEKLEQEIKRYQNELERAKQCHGTELQPCSTPQKMFATPVTPSHRQFEPKVTELQEKYNREVEEKKKLESELKVLQAKLLNQSSVSHKDIARQQTQSSIFPWQQEQTTHCQSGYIDTPLKRKTGSCSFLWEPGETPVKQNSRSTALSVTQNESSSSEAFELLRETNQDLKAKLSEFELRLQSQDKELKNQVKKFQEIHGQLDKTKTELNEKDKVLTKCRDELTKVSQQYDQAVAKCSSVEQKLKQVTEEMNCQRHNAESSRRALEQRLKDQEKESQKELAHQQNSQHALEQQLNQTKTKMNQELQQAKKDYVMLQSDIDKVTAQKNRIEKEVEELKAKLCRSEQALQASQVKEMDIKKKFEEMQKERNSFSSKLEQSVKRLSEVEEETKAVRQNLKQSNSKTEDLKAKTQAQSEELKGLRAKLDSQARSSLQDMERLKKLLTDLEMKKEASEEEIQKQRIEMEQMINKNTVLEKERQEMNFILNSKQNECDELRSQTECLLRWKNEKESLINNIETEREAMLNRIGELEKNVATLEDAQSNLKKKLKHLEKERETLMAQIDSLKGDLLNKCVELEGKEQVHYELQKRFEEADQKHSKDLEDAKVQITLLQGQLTDLEARLQQETSKLEKLELSHNELLTQYENACDLAKSKDSVIELNQNEIVHLRESLAWVSAEQEQQLIKFTEEKCNLMKEYEKNLSAKNDEAEQAKLNFEKSQQELPFLNDQIASLDSALNRQKHLAMELQTKIGILSTANDDLQDKISKAEKNEENLLHELSALSEQAKTANSLQEQLSSLSAAEEESKCALQKATEALNQKNNELQDLSGRVEELKRHVMETETKALNLQKEKVGLEEKFKWLEKSTEELSSKNQSLLEANSVLCEEKTCLLREKAAAEEKMLADEKRLEASNQHCVELTSLVEVLQGKYASAMELNSKLESNLKDQSDQKSVLEKEMKIFAEKHSLEIKDYDEKQRNLMAELALIKGELENKSSEISEVNISLKNNQSEILQLRMDIAAANDELIKANDSHKIIIQERDYWMEKGVSYQNEIESLRAFLSTAENGLDQKEDLIRSLRKNVHDTELEQVKLTRALKEKDLTMNKIKVQLEMLQMDLEDNEFYMNSFDSKIEAFQSNISSLEEKLLESESQRSTMENELSSLREELALKDNEISQAKSNLEDVSKHKQNLSSLTIEIESLQAAKSKLQVAVEEEILKYSTLEQTYNELSEKNLKLEAEVQNLRGQWCNIQDQNNGLKYENDSLKEMLQIQKEEYQSLKSTAEKVSENSDNTSKAFDKEQMELHQRCAFLQSENAIMKEQQSNLLCQVSKQQSFIEQLKSRGGHVVTPECEGDICQSTSSFANISLSNDGDFEGINVLGNLNERDVLHSSAIIEESTTGSCVPCEITSGSVSSSNDGASCLQSAADNIVCSLEGQDALKLQEEQEYLHTSDQDVFSLEIEHQKKTEELEVSSPTFGEVVRSTDGLMEAEQQVLRNENVDVKGPLGDVQEDLEQLQKRHFYEVQSWKQKLVNLSLEMEAKLVAERQHAAILSAELEAARLQIQGLDLSSRSLLCDDNEESLLQLQSHSEKKDLVTPQKNDTPKTEDIKDGASLGACSPQGSFTADVTASNENLTVDITQKNGVQEHGFEDLSEHERTIQKLQDELQAVHSQFELFAAENTSRKEFCTQMEMKLRQLEEEKLHSVSQLKSTIEKKQRAEDRVKKLEEEVGTLKLQLQTSKCQLTDIMEMLGASEMAKGDWDERVFQLESDLKRVQSEKANLEKHILLMEADIEEMQNSKQKLEQDFEANKKMNVNLEKKLNLMTSEGLQLKQELLLCTEKEEEAGQALLRWKEKVEWLEKENIETRELNKILEADIRKQKKDSEIASNSLDNLQNEKKQLLAQLEVLEQTITLLSGEKNNLLMELNRFKEQQCEVSQSSEAAVIKIQTLEMENSRLSHLMESSLLEKGEIASRLNSTQEEVIEMRVGIEKLRVRIEADERKKRQMGDLLKDAQRKADTLQDKLENLEKEKEMTEQSLEDAVLQAETAKAEFEELEAENIDLTKRFEQLTVDQNDLRSEKERLEREVVQKTEQLQKIEREMKEAEVNFNVTTEELQFKLSAVTCQLQICQRDLESMQLKEQDLTGQLFSLKSENVHLSQKLQEIEKVLLELESKNQLLDKEIVTKQNELKVTLEENDKFRQQVAALQMSEEDNKEKRAILEAEIKELEREKRCLQSAVEDWERKVEMTSAKCEVMQITMSSLEGSLQQKEEYLQSARLTNAGLSEKIDVLNKQNLKLQSDITAALSSTEVLRVALETERHALCTQQQSAEQQMESIKLTLEKLSSQKEELTRVKEDLEREVKERTVAQEDLLNQFQQHQSEFKVLQNELSAAEEMAADYLAEITNMKSSKEELNLALQEMQGRMGKLDELSQKVTQLSKEKDTALSKLALWINACKQLENEKQVLLAENERQGVLITALQTKEKQDTEISDKTGEGSSCSSMEDLQAQIRELKDSLEEKTREADESMDKYCSLLVSLHKLEEANETLHNQVSQLTRQTASRGRKSTSKSYQSPAVTTSQNQEDGQASGKRQRASGPEENDEAASKAQETLHSIAKKIRACATPQVARRTQAEEEFRPEGLPELVKKGFADIPVGEASPFIMRRTTVRRCSPRLAAKKSPVSQPNPDPAVHNSSQPTGGSSQQTIQETKMLLSPAASPSGVLASVTNSSRIMDFGSPMGNKEEQKGRRSLSLKRTPEQREKRQQRRTSAKQDENCQVQ